MVELQNDSQHASNDKVMTIAFLSVPSMGLDDKKIKYVQSR